MRSNTPRVESGISFGNDITVNRDLSQHTTKTVNGNEQEVTGKVPGVGVERRPPTIEEVLEAFQIDLTVWEPKEATINRWDQGAKTDKGMITQVLYQVKIRLIRKVAVATAIPAVQPIAINVIAKKIHPIAPRNNGVRKALILSDMHLGFRRVSASGKLEPFHDRTAIDIVLQLIEETDPDDIIINGDALDCTEWTDKFIRYPEFHLTTQPSLVELSWIIGYMRAFAPSARIIYLEGNHEKRIPNHMSVHLSMAWDVTPGDDHPLLSIPTMLNLENMGVEWVDNYPDNSIWLNDNVQVIHWSNKAKVKGSAARGLLSHSRSSIIFGHTHQEESVALTTGMYAGERTYRAECFGMLGNPQRTPADTSMHNWQQGLGFVYYEPENGNFYTEKVPIHGGKVAMYRGSEFVGVDYTEDLRKDTGWKSF